RLAIPYGVDDLFATGDVAVIIQFLPRARPPEQIWNAAQRRQGHDHPVEFTYLGGIGIGKVRPPAVSCDRPAGRKHLQSPVCLAGHWNWGGPRKGRVAIWAEGCGRRRLLGELCTWVEGSYVGSRVEGDTGHGPRRQILGGALSEAEPSATAYID